MTDAPAAPAQKSKLKSFLTKTFNFAASAGVGAVVGIGIKSACLAVFGSQAAALVPAAALIGAASAGIQRGKDMYNWNKTHADGKVGARDFFKFEKTGHSSKHYFKKAAVSAGFGLVGGMIGLHFSHAACAGAPDIHHVATVPAPAPLPVPVPVPVHVPTPDENLANLLNEAKSHLPAHHCAGIDNALHRLGSAHENVKAQAIKDLGYYYANGFCGVHENDVLADKLFQAAITVSHGHNIQALNDLGYQTLHGFGTPQDSAKAFDLLTKAAAGGDRLTPPLLDYMHLHHMVPAGR